MTRHCKPDMTKVVAARCFLYGSRRDPDGEFVLPH